MQRLAIFCLSAVFAVSAFAAITLSGRVVSIADGDTLTLLVENRQVKVRLAEIDAPERSQPFGTQARQALAAMAFQKDARVVVIDIDRYQRTVGRVYVGDTDVNAELVRQGFAWVYRRYARDNSLFPMETEARTAGMGLWADPNPVPPWEWRRGERARRTAPATTGTSTGGFTCGTKRYCREMRSCDEARFYLSQCKLTRLDGDNDGVPCEKLCR